MYVFICESCEKKIISKVPLGRIVKLYKWELPFAGLFKCRSRVCHLVHSHMYAHMQAFVQARRIAMIRVICEDNEVVKALMVLLGAPVALRAYGSSAASVEL